MKVLKFGGTSVGSVDSILSLKKIVESQTEQVVVVVSALGGITDKLIYTSQLAVKGDDLYKTEFNDMVTRHHNMVNTIITDKAHPGRTAGGTPFHLLWRLSDSRPERQDDGSHSELWGKTQ